MATSSDHTSPLRGYVTVDKLMVLGGTIAVITIAYLLALCIYNVYFHPLSKFPGPKLAVASPAYTAFYGIFGQRHKLNAQLHEKYGEIVRTGPAALSFINETAWKDIYMHRQGQQHRQMQKTFNRPAANGAWSIITAPDDIHGRLRRGLSHAFSEKALREQEPLIKTHIDLLVSNLHEDATAGRETDMVAYLNFLTFDLIGDLAFAESFDALRTRTSHPWMTTFYRSVRVGIVVSLSMLIFPPIKPLIALLAYPLRGVQRKQFQYCADRVDKRIESGSDRPDLMREVLNGNEKEEEGKGMSRDEIKATFDILMIAGSETTATLLSGCFYLLLTHSDVYAKLKKEVREAFTSDDEITVVKVNQLSYLLAVLEESLRIYPPVPIALPRRTPPEGASICGVWVPGDTVVGVPQLAAYHSPTNFTEPDSFIPERFLPGKNAKFENDRKAVFQPFSAGPRNCLGRNLAYAEMKLVLARCVYSFDFALGENNEDWLKRQRTFVLWEKPQLMLKVKKRES